MNEQVPAPSDLVRSVSRAFRILEEVGASTAPLTVKAVARRCGLNLSTAYHLVRTLTYEGYLVRDRAGLYVLGSSVARRFHDLQASFDQPPEVHEVLRHLSAMTRRTAYLGRFVSGRILITDLVEGPESPYLEDLEVGLNVAAHATVIGKVLLAAMPRARRTAYLAEQGMRRFTTRTVIDTDSLEVELAGLRAGEPVLEHGQFRDGVSCVGALVRRSCPEDSWAVVASTRADEVPAQVVWHTMRAAEDLAPAR
ncbi:MAG: helix-turn-helix domain-containing protein [Actinophytocola sp.]|uniref:IclR family transcriptional regulator n=1 Tax=Actinophytocola sp. TaxID=1872138 RepID=UPI0013240FB8|nr:IclR family transcriptional regulator C-terminal domain-containing protein [Actinophytocola sp.]MPZ85492.1 helix-turn-helix domain-containing protein [Actinophytocola sp.]